MQKIGHSTWEVVDCLRGVSKRAVFRVLEQTARIEGLQCVGKELQPAGYKFALVVVYCMEDGFVEESAEPAVGVEE